MILLSLLIVFVPHRADAQKKKKAKPDVTNNERLVAGEVIENLAEFVDYFDAESERIQIPIVRDLGRNVQDGVAK